MFQWIESTILCWSDFSFNKHHFWKATNLLRLKFSSLFSKLQFPILAIIFERPLFRVLSNAKVQQTHLDKVASNSKQHSKLSNALENRKGKSRGSVGEKTRVFSWKQDWRVKLFFCQSDFARLLFVATLFKGRDKQVEKMKRIKSVEKVVPFHKF